MTHTTTDAAEARALKPCPFCGGEAKLGNWASDYVRCVDCRVEQIGLTPAQAIEAWNTRHRLATAEAASGAGEREDKVERCWECSCGWKGCYTAEQIAEHGEPAECNRCCRERLEEVEPTTSSTSLPPATDPAIPDGWKLVPVEPTDAMWYRFDAHNGDKRTGYDTWLKAWADILAAAPTIPATEEIDHG